MAITLQTTPQVVFNMVLVVFCVGALALILTQKQSLTMASPPPPPVPPPPHSSPSSIGGGNHIVISAPASLNDSLPSAHPFLEQKTAPEETLKPAGSLPSRFPVATEDGSENSFSIRDSPNNSSENSANNNSNKLKENPSGSETPPAGPPSSSLSSSAKAPPANKAISEGTLFPPPNILFGASAINNNNKMGGGEGDLLQYPLSKQQQQKLQHELLLPVSDSVIVRGWNYSIRVLAEILPESWMHALGKLPDTAVPCIVRLGYSRRFSFPEGINLTDADDGFEESEYDARMLAAVREECGHAPYDALRELQEAVNDTLKQLPPHAKAIHDEFTPKWRHFQQKVRSGEKYNMTEFHDLVSDYIHALEALDANERAKLAELFPKMAGAIQDSRLNQLLELLLSAVSGDTGAVQPLKALSAQIFKNVTQAIRQVVSEAEALEKEVSAVAKNHSSSSYPSNKTLALKGGSPGADEQHEIFAITDNQQQHSQQNQQESDEVAADVVKGIVEEVANGHNRRRRRRVRRDSPTPTPGSSSPPPGQLAPVPGIANFPEKQATQINVEGDDDDNATSSGSHGRRRRSAADTPSSPPNAEVAAKAAAAASALNQHAASFGKPGAMPHRKTPLSAQSAERIRLLGGKVPPSSWW